MAKTDSIGCCLGCLFFLFICFFLVAGFQYHHDKVIHPHLESHNSYEDIARSPNGTPIECTGRISQITYSKNGEIQGLMEIAPDYFGDIFFSYSYQKVKTNLLQNDIVTVTGTTTGPITLERTSEWSKTLFGNTRTIPGIKIDSVYFEGPAEEPATEEPVTKAQE